jgi:hypothetical protein
LLPLFAGLGISALGSTYGGDGLSFFVSIAFSISTGFFEFSASASAISAVASSLTVAGVGVGVEFGVDSLDAAPPSDRLSSLPLSRSRRNSSY